MFKSKTRGPVNETRGPTNNTGASKRMPCTWQGDRCDTRMSVCCHKIFTVIPLMPLWSMHKFVLKQ